MLINHPPLRSRPTLLDVPRRIRVQSWAASHRTPGTRESGGHRQPSRECHCREQGDVYEHDVAREPHSSVCRYGSWAGTRRMWQLGVSTIGAIIIVFIGAFLLEKIDPHFATRDGN